VDRKTDDRKVGTKDDCEVRWTGDESLVSDVRAGLTPAEMVEKKLVTLLDSTPLTLRRLPSGHTHRASL